MPRVGSGRPGRGRRRTISLALTRHQPCGGAIETIVRYPLLKPTAPPIAKIGSGSGEPLRDWVMFTRPPSPLWPPVFWVTVVTVVALGVSDNPTMFASRCSPVASGYCNERRSMRDGFTKSKKLIARSRSSPHYREFVPVCLWLTGRCRSGGCRPRTGSFFRRRRSVLIGDPDRDRPQKPTRRPGVEPVHSLAASPKVDFSFIA